MKTLKDLQAIREKMRLQIGNRRIADANDTRIAVGMATCGIAAGARPVLAAITEEIYARKLQNVLVSQTACMGMCKYEPIVEVFVPGQAKVTYVHMTPDKVKSMFVSHVVNGKAVTEFTLGNEKA